MQHRLDFVAPFDVQRWVKLEDAMIVSVSDAARWGPAQVSI
jgi:hypothetical protein